MSTFPLIIQGGMGAGVSHWQLARTVSKQGQLGVVSGTALAHILARRLQDGDPGGHLRRGLDNFPFPEMAERIWREYYIAGGKSANSGYKSAPIPLKQSREYSELCVAANFVEVFLAREGHDNPVGINYLEKIQMPHLPSIFGAMLAGVDYIIMGAGIPLRIPGVLDRFANLESATYPLQFAGSPDGVDSTVSFVPREFIECPVPPLKRPKFLAIVSSNVLAVTMLKRANGRVDGLIIEGPTAGGHNAPPRGKLRLSESGEALYGERDTVDLEAIRALGVPFWLAGGYGTPEKLQQALAAGATGVQVGTAFAFCIESGLRKDYKAAILKDVARGQAKVFTDPASSPTGFPFKAVQVTGSASERKVYEERVRFCDLGYLHELYVGENGELRSRCPAEPPEHYASKGGALADTVGRKCLCNSLMANIGLQQTRKNGYVEEGLVTAGDDLRGITRFFRPDGTEDYSAADVLAKLLPARRS